MTPREEDWLALNLVARVGGKTIDTLIERFGDVASVLQAPPESIRHSCGLHPDLAERICNARTVPAFLIERRLVEEHGVRLIPIDSEQYPIRLRDAYLPPPLLYCRGTLPLPEGPVLSVVGTRSHTRYGEKVTRQLITGLAESMPATVIVSGLARGIDAIAHEQALNSGLSTIAVLGGGLCDIYPREHRALAERIAGQGALISEFHMNERPLARNFPIRNRVIGALSDAVLVIEAGDRSGALITASFALNYGRPVLAVPGNIDQPASQGTNRLLQSGQGVMVRDAADVVAVLRGADGQVNAHAQRPLPRHEAEGSGKAAQAGEKGNIVDCLRKGPLHPDDLAEEIAVPIEKLIGLLLELELSGDIVQTADNQYTLA